MSSSGDTAERDVSDRLVRDRSSSTSLPQTGKHREAPNTGRPQTPGGPKHREAPNTGRPQTPGGHSRGHYHGVFSKAVSATHAPKYANASQIKIMRGKKNV